MPAIDLYLASTMRQSDDLAMRIAASGIHDQSLREFKEKAYSAGFANPLTLRREHVLRLFGCPARDEGDRLVYALKLWPAHEFDWLVDTDNRVVHGGFRLAHEVPLPQWLPLDLLTAEEHFRCWYHTYSDVKRVYGDASKDLGWGEMGEWYYALDSGDSLLFTFDYGLLRDIEQVPTPDT